MHRFTLPFPPTLNTYYRHVGRMVLISSKGRKYREEIVSIVGPKFPTMTGKLRVELHCYPPDRRRRDLDNLLKALLDALEHANVYENDNQIDVLTISRHGKVDEGLVAVQVSEIQQEPEA